MKHKDSLKREILRKRAVLERELKRQAQAEVELEMRLYMKSAEKRKTAKPLSPARPTLPSRIEVYSKHSGADKQTERSHSAKLKRNHDGKLKSEKDQVQLFCFCRTPYDDSQFYIGCDRCDDWFHGTCVNITEDEASKIDDYHCPRCLKSELAHQLRRDARMQMLPLGTPELNALKRLVNKLKCHTMAWPFLQPHNGDDGKQGQVKDLFALEQRLLDRRYSSLENFMSDVSFIFSSGVNKFGPASPHARCAALLEPVMLSGLVSILKDSKPIRHR